MVSIESLVSLIKIGYDEQLLVKSSAHLINRTQTHSKMVASYLPEICAQAAQIVVLPTV